GSPRAMSSGPLVTCRALQVGFAGRAILPPIDLSIQRGELWGVVGRNGAGKSTLFRTLLGLHPTVAGSIARQDGLGVAYVAQRHGIDPLLPARAKDLIAEGCEKGLSFLRPFRDAEQRARIRRASTETGCEPLLHRRFR